KLFVGGLSFNTTSDGLREFFGQSGTVVSATVVTDQFSGRSKGFGFVEMESNEQAQNAVAHLNGRDLDGRSIKVEVAKPKTEGRRDSSRGGYGGNRGGGGGGGRGRWWQARPEAQRPRSAVRWLISACRTARAAARHCPVAGHARSPPSPHAAR